MQFIGRNPTSLWGFASRNSGEESRKIPLCLWLGMGKVTIMKYIQSISMTKICSPEEDFTRAFSHWGEKAISLTPVPSSLHIWEEEGTKKLLKVTVQGYRPTKRSVFQHKIIEQFLSTIPHQSHQLGSCNNWFIAKRTTRQKNLSKEEFLGKLEGNRRDTNMET